MVRGVQWEAMGGAHVRLVTSQCRRVAASSTNEFGCEAMLVGRVMFCGDSCSGVLELQHCIKLMNRVFISWGNADCFQ